MLRNICYRQIWLSKKYTNVQNNLYLDSAKNIHCNVCLRKPRQTPKSNRPTPKALNSKYQVFAEENSPIIRNTEEELNYASEKYPMISDEFDGINLQRGQTGVFDIEDLVELLHRENAKDTFVATVPKEINYVEYICVVSARSKRHIGALAEFVRRVFKKKCYKDEAIPRIEGKDSNEWMALDLGNIALHVFSDDKRKVYDLETLWSVGPEFDEQTQKKSKPADVFESYSSFLKDLKPLG